MKKKPYTNPAIYILFCIQAYVLIYFFFFSEKDYAHPQILAGIYVLLFLVISFYALRRLHPLKYNRQELFIQVNFLINYQIRVQDIIKIEHMNRYDTWIIYTKEKKIRIPFLVDMDEFKKDFKSKII